ARAPHGMDHFVAALDGGEDGVPLALDVGAVGVQLTVETGVAQHALARGDVWRDGYPGAERHDTEIGDDLHAPNGCSQTSLRSIASEGNNGDGAFARPVNVRPGSKVSAVRIDLSAGRAGLLVRASNIVNVRARGSTIQ